ALEAAASQTNGRGNRDRQRNEEPAATGEPTAGTKAEQEPEPSSGHSLPNPIPPAPWGSGSPAAPSREPDKPASSERDDPPSPVAQREITDANDASPADGRASAVGDG